MDVGRRCLWNACKVVWSTARATWERPNVEMPKWWCSAGDVPLGCMSQRRAMAPCGRFHCLLDACLVNVDPEPELGGKAFWSAILSLDSICALFRLAIANRPLQQVLESSRPRTTVSISKPFR